MVNGFLNGIGASFGSFGGARSAAGRKGGIPQTLKQADILGTASAVTLTNGKFTKFGTGKTVPAQQIITYGQGDAGNPDNQGYIYLQPRNAADSSRVTGLVRLVAADANEFVIDVVLEESAVILYGNQAAGTITTDRRLLKPLPMLSAAQYTALRRQPKEDDILFVSMNPDTTTTAASTSLSDVLIPVTLFPQ